MFFFLIHYIVETMHWKFLEIFVANVTSRGRGLLDFCWATKIKRS